MVEKRKQERRQQERRQHERRRRIEPGAPLPGGLAGRKVVIESVAELVAEIRAAAPEIPLEWAEAIAIGIRHDWHRGHANIRKESPTIPEAAITIRERPTAQRHGWIVLEAHRLAESGNFTGYMSIEAHIRLHDGLPEVHDVLDDEVLRRKLDEICKRARARR